MNSLVATCSNDARTCACRTLDMHNAIDTDGTMIFYSLQPHAKRLLESLGGSLLDVFGFRDNYALIGQKGIVDHSPFEYVRVTCIEPDWHGFPSMFQAALCGFVTQRCCC